MIIKGTISGCSCGKCWFSKNKGKLVIYRGNSAGTSYFLKRGGMQKFSLQDGSWRWLFKSDIKNIKSCALKIK